MDVLKCMSMYKYACVGLEKILEIYEEILLHLILINVPVLLALILFIAIIKNNY